MKHIITTLAVLAVCLCTAGCGPDIEQAIITKANKICEQHGGLDRIEYVWAMVWLPVCVCEDGTAKRMNVPGGEQCRQ